MLLISGRRTETRCDDSVAAFHRVYTGDDGGLVESVVLACTHHRWKDVGRPLLEGLVERDVVDDGHVRQLATVLLYDDDARVTAPGAWLVEFYLQKRHGEMRRLDPAKTYTLHRMIGPQVRRWAARQSVRGCEDVGPVLRRAQALDSRHGAAVIQGLLDSADRLDEDTAAAVLDIGLDWPNPSVRLPALKRLAAAGRHGEALERAQADRAAHIRRWAATSRQGILINERGDPAASADATAQPRRRTPQLSLFA